VNPYICAEAMAADAPFTVRMEVALRGNDEETRTIEIEVHPEWAPIGAARFKELVRTHLAFHERPPPPLPASPSARPAIRES
jgi:hypothetical protein